MYQMLQVRAKNVCCEENKKIVKQAHYTIFYVHNNLTIV